ncbi:MAG: mannose-6-phosphate isomerase, class I [Ruminococcus sp.]|nr:mannose-6-phosphate isomerase, class I [Ruminococcus sp.]
MDIMKLRPAVKDYIWGGKRLTEEYGKISDTERISETWECSVHPDGMSIVTTGEHTGKTLYEVISEYPEYLGQNNRGDFPVLVKFIDAGKDLSVQVHPDDVYARIHENENGKNEMWYILEADENAVLIYGFEEEISPDTVRRAVYDGTITDYLHYEKVQKGDVFYIPSGTVHAIGRGMVVAEIQQSSNITYRVYDYDRIDADGKKRKLHLEKALDVMKLCPAEKIKPFGKFDCPEYSAVTLCECDYFRTERIIVRKKYSFDVDIKTFRIILLTDGAGIIENSGKAVSVRKGDCIFLPAGIGETTISGVTVFLKIEC